MKPLIIAHRGASAAQGDDTENPLAQGADYIEVDLEVSRDGIVFIFHDPRVGIFVFREPYIRLPGGVKKKAHELLFSEIQKMFPSVISFEEFIKTVDPAHIIGELKSYSCYKGIVHILHRMYPDAFHKMRFISFSMRALQEIKLLDPSLYCSYIATSGGDDKRFHPIVRKQHINACVKNNIEEISGLWIMFRPRMIRYAHAHGLRVGLGQMNTLRRILYAQKNEVDVWYTDNVRYAQKYIV